MTKPRLGKQRTVRGAYSPAAMSRLWRKAVRSAVVKRSIVIAGHKTSISLEDEFWDGLKEIARARGFSDFTSSGYRGLGPSLGISRSSSQTKKGQNSKHQNYRSSPQGRIWPCRTMSSDF